MKKFRLLFYIVPVVLVIGVVFAAFMWSANSKPVSNSPSKISFVITKGSSASQIGNKLKEAGIIRNAFVFKVYLQLTGNSGRIQAGEYILSANKSLIQIVKEFLNGPSQIWVTIPEGLRKEEIAIRFAVSLDKQGEEKNIFINDFISLTRTSEGYLFPDTYLVPKDISASKVVDLMKNTFEKKMSSINADVSTSIHSVSEIVIVASLIERETRTNEERPLVAGVIYKRIAEGWPLQVDATVQYAVANTKLKSQPVTQIKYWEEVSKLDINIPSPYNTYKYQGIIPSPICSPGLTSLKAAASPQNSEYWFYIHDGSGQIHFAKTIEEHNQNIRKYLGK